MRYRSLALWQSLTFSLLLTAGCGLSATAQDGEVPEPTDAPAPASGFELVTVLDGLNKPWGMAWLPNGQMLITEKGGALKLVEGDQVVADIPGTPPVYAGGQGGLMDVSLHPDFASNSLVYLTYSEGSGGENRTCMGRGTFEDNRLNDFEELYCNPRYKNGGQHFGSRVVWLEDGTMLLAIGDGGNPPVELDGEHIRNHAQSLDYHFGKVLRLNDDGSAPADNPFPDEAPLVYSYGHRNIQGMAMDRSGGRVWANEHGAKGGDEVNLLEEGENYGWPVATFSDEYWGPPVSENETLPGMVDAIVVWTPSPAPSGLEFYTGNVMPDWQGDLFSGGLASRDVRRIDLDEQGNVLGQEQIQVGRRVRDVRQGPDGYLYLITDETNGELIRIEPAS